MASAAWFMSAWGMVLFGNGFLTIFPGLLGSAVVEYGSYISFANSGRPRLSVPIGVVPRTAEKSPLRMADVRVAARYDCVCSERNPSQYPEKNVCFLITGPPT